MPSFSAFGDNNYYARVSDYVQNRDPLFDIHDIIEAPDDIVLDMNLQDDGNDGDADAIDVNLVGPGNNRAQITIGQRQVVESVAVPPMGRISATQLQARSVCQIRACVKLKKSLRNADAL